MATKAFVQMMQISTANVLSISKREVVTSFGCKPDAPKPVTSVDDPNRSALCDAFVKALEFMAGKLHLNTRTSMWEISVSDLVLGMNLDVYVHVYNFHVFFLMLYSSTMLAIRIPLLSTLFHLNMNRTKFES